MPFRDAWLLVGGLLLLVGFAAEQPVIGGVGLAVVVLGGVTRGWSRRLFDRLAFTHSLSERRAFAGEKVTLSVSLDNRKLIPLPWFEWRLGVAGTLAVEGEKLAASAAPGMSFLVRRGALGWYRRQDWRFTLVPAERGYHQLGPTSLRSADLLGVFPRALDQDVRDRLVVFPRVVPLEDLGLPADRPFGERKGGERIFEDPLRIAGLRDYRPGDPLRRIDWKASARARDLQSRVYEPSAQQQIYLFVNIDTMRHAWEGYLRDELERIVTAAASIATWAAGQRVSLGLLANGAFPDADRPIRLPPSRSADQITRVLEALAVVQPLTLGDLAGAIDRERGKLAAGSTIVVIASLIPEPLTAAISRLHDEGHRVAVVATSRRALSGVPPGIITRDISHALERIEVATW